jgi:signal transduction histidine kinase
VRPDRRTTLAAILIGIAVLLPTGAWYITGSREAARQAAALEVQARRQLRNDLEGEAERLGNHLESLRAQESERPFFHYQTIYRDPRAAAEGLAVTTSPLISGGTDPLVWAHFQIDEGGLVTLPTVSERFPELSSDGDFSAFCTLLEELQSAVVMDEARNPDLVADEERVLTMTGSAWEQIALAESDYASITGRAQGPRGPVQVAPDVGRVAIRVRPLGWHTMVLGSGPVLAALREVHTPAGIVLQGFAVAPPAIAQWLDAGSLPLRFIPGPPRSGDSLASPVSFTGWILDLAESDPAVEPSAEANAVLTQFRRVFAITAGAIVLAASAVILILFQTDRLARQRARFAAAAAHELKTPLAGLLLHAEMLAENLGDQEHRSRYAATVSSEADRLGRVVSNMLDLARLERATPTVTPRPGDLGLAVEGRVERQRRRLEDAGVGVELEIDADMPRALFDADALAQIIDNLLDNAEKHSRTVANRRVKVTVGSSGEGIRVAIQDTGPGIPRAQRRSLFRPFDRAENAAGTPGLGLGLAVARSLAKAQGGELELDAEYRDGARFILEIPRA